MANYCQRCHASDHIHGQTMSINVTTCNHCGETEIVTRVTTKDRTAPVPPDSVIQHIKAAVHEFALEHGRKR